MRCLIRSMVKGAAQEQVLETDALTFGRSSQNLVELPGLLVSPLHAKIVQEAPGRWRIQSAALAGVELNEVVGIRDSQLREGDVIGIGEHRVRVLAPRGGAELALEVELGDPGRAFARSAARTELLGAGLRQRAPALVLFLGVLVVGLVIPLIAATFSESERATLGFFSDRLWESEPVAPVHAHFGKDCAQCHERAFVRVQDSACLQCHENVAHHSDQAAIRTLSPFERRCASCHDEHAGKDQLVADHPELCTNCHAKPQFADFPGLRPASDFGKVHPEFRPLVTVAAADGSRRREKRAQDPQLKDFGPLIFPHDLHLVKEGVRAVEGTEQLQCDDCHVPSAGKFGFTDVRYDRHCARCHRLDTFVGDTALQLPHGDNLVVWNLLGQLAGKAPDVAAPAPAVARRLPGEAAPRGGPMTLDDQLTDVFERRVCAKCHEVERDAENRPRVREVKLPHTWFTSARFTHAAHAWVACENCHAASKSKSSETLLLPDLESCRTCHGGVASRDQVQSTCIDCHQLHRATQPWLANAGGKDRGQARAAEPSTEDREPDPVR